MIHSILMIGQSNMAGRGFAHEVEPIQNKDILVLKNGRWRSMFVPVNPDRSTSGICPVESFADCYNKDKGVQVGIIPCADVGSSLDQWAVGGLLFDHACYMTKLAQRTSTVAAVLWHQGESDCSDERYPLYKEKLLRILDAFRERLGLHDVPFLLGGLGDFLPAYGLPNYVHVNAALKDITAVRERVGFVSAEGLGSNPDMLHFSAKAQREFGLRYYREFLRLEDKDRIFEEKPSPDLAIVNAMELL